MSQPTIQEATLAAGLYAVLKSVQFSDGMRVFLLMRLRNFNFEEMLCACFNYNTY